MLSKDFLGFMSNLVNCLKLGRNTSLDKDTTIMTEDYSEEASKPYLFVIDNARQHTANIIKNIIVENYSVLFLPSYSPMLNPIELWFSQLKKKVANKYYGT